jgi:hypothetical protein
LLFPGAAGAISLVPLKVPYAGDVVLPQMPKQFFTKTMRADTADEKNILVLIP